MRLEKNDITLDFFAGSGTSAAVAQKMGLNWIAIEVSMHELVKNRLKGVLFGDSTGVSKLINNKGGSYCYLAIESYEDTLNNLQLNRPKSQQLALEQNEKFKEQYLLSYMLDVETRDSASLLNLFALSDPFSYKLRVLNNDNELEEVSVDIIETFNYLLGLHVKTRHTREGMVIISGYLAQTEEQVLLIWRNANEVDDDQLQQVYAEYKGTGYDRVYINGDNTVNGSNLHLIEREFSQRMFA